LNSLSLQEKERLVLRFVIGNAVNSSVDDMLMSESTKFHDIVRVPIVEDYFNLTLKTGEFLKWAVASYNFDWVFKCDDDSFVRVDKLLETLAAKGTDHLYLGKIWTGTPVDRRVDKYTPSRSYSKFAAGAGYALSHDLASYIVRNYDSLHKWPMEDVAVGMWLSAVNVNYFDHPNFHSLPEGCDKDMIVQNPANVTVMKETFFNMVKGVPCHANPDPFDPSTKNVPDHVLIQLGIPKSDNIESAITPRGLGGAQFLISTESSVNQLGDEAMDKEDDEAEAHFDKNEGGMAESEMNNNSNPSKQTMTDMNGPATTETLESLDAASVAATDRMNEAQV
jgi:hypothetical protein